jgi:hypothetical protein
MWPYWFIDLDLTCSSPLHRSVGTKSCSSFTIAWSFASKPRLALHLHNRSIEPSLILIFSTLVTWLYVMSHMQWVPSWHHHMWTNLLCISHNHILVHLSCHLITKNKQGPFRCLVWCIFIPTFLNQPPSCQYLLLPACKLSFQILFIFF